jgi:hypothetical protein
MKKTNLCLVAVLALVATGCQPAQKYYWGSYEDLVYVSYAEPGKVSPEAQIKILEGDVSFAAAHHKALPPGFQAHLGYLYSKIGNKEAARSNFEAEKRQFPESTVLMDRLLSNLARS